MIDLLASMISVIDKCDVGRGGASPAHCCRFSGTGIHPLKVDDIAGAILEPSVAFASPSGKSQREAKLLTPVSQRVRSCFESYLRKREMMVQHQCQQRER